MQSKKSIILAFIAIISVTIGCIILNFALDFETTLRSAIGTSIYLAAWIIFINIAIKNKVKAMIAFHYLIWGLTLITSIIIIIVNALPNLVETFTFGIVLVLIFITPISGLAFVDSGLICGIIFFIVSTILILIPTIKDRYNKLKEEDKE